MEADVKLMRDYIKKTIEEAMKNMPPIDPKMFENIRKAEKQESRRGRSATVGEQYMAEKQLAGGLVKENIRMRAELREKKMMRLPGIASMMTGGAPGPIGLMNTMQKQASRPFKGVYDYKAKEQELADFNKAQPFGPMSKEKRKEQGDLEEETAGLKKRASSGMGKNLMGKRMQGMIGKVGKFMESSKGQGMMAGGMMGASILTMIIKKAMEASPMLQQMLKIMNVAMTLFLRPIGDFIGGMLKPIMLFFLREIAVPMLNKGKSMIKYGETFGKQVLGFLLKPVETIQAAIMGALGAFPGMSDIALLAQKFDGIKEWMTEQKMGVFASQIGLPSIEIQKLLNLERQSKEPDLDIFGNPALVQLPNTKAENAAIAELEKLRAAFPKVMASFKAFFKDLRTNVYEQVGKLDTQSASNTTISGSMGMVVGEFARISEAGSTLTSTFIALNTAMGVWHTSQGGELQELINESKAANPEAWGKALGGSITEISPTGDVVITPTGGTDVTVEEPKNWNDIAVFNTPAKMLARLQDMVGAATGATPGGAKTIAEYQEITKGGTISAAEGITAHFEKIERLTALMGTDMTMAELNTNGLKLDTDTMLTSTKEMVNNFLKGGELTEGMVEKLQKMIANMSVSHARTLGFGGRNMQSLGFDAGSTLQMVHGKILPLSKAAISHYAGIGVKTTPMQHGGMINEPIWGIGASGKEYTLGESGPEMVTPMNKVGVGGIGPVTINVNVDSINSEVDLEKIKPVIERALHEVHARRGII